jgi:hypothetical protein
MAVLATAAQRKARNKQVQQNLPKNLLLILIIAKYVSFSLIAYKAQIRCQF